MREVYILTKQVERRVVFNGNKNHEIRASTFYGNISNITYRLSALSWLLVLTGPSGYLEIPSSSLALITSWICSR